MSAFANSTPCVQSTSNVSLAPTAFVPPRAGVRSPAQGQPGSTSQVPASAASGTRAPSAGPSASVGPRTVPYREPHEYRRWSEDETAALMRARGETRERSWEATHEAFAAQGFDRTISALQRQWGKISGRQAEAEAVGGTAQRRPWTAEENQRLLDIDAESRHSLAEGVAPPPVEWVREAQRFPGRSRRDLPQRYYIVRRWSEAQRERHRAALVEERLARSRWGAQGGGARASGDGSGRWCARFLLDDTIAAS